jgi:GNAT superfamily N-acetyltransferase
MIRPAVEAELSVLQRLDAAAGASFVSLGMVDVAEDGPLRVETLRQYLPDHIWVWIENDTPAAYLVASVVDGNAHIDQVSVHPDHARRRIGAKLIDHLAHWARQRKMSELTLTTFVDVPWNAPYYRRLGFRPLTPDEETPGLRAIRLAEQTRSLDRYPRQCMTLSLNLET